MILQPFEAKIASLLGDLPDPEGARLFWTRLATEQPKAARQLLLDEGLLSDVFALAAWSPLLGTTLEQNPSYINWLGRERAFTRVKTQEEFFESLARFALTNTQLAPQVLLARFRRRELLRIYLRDLRNTATIVETTEELSNLADAVLQYALRLADQELNNFYGAPLMIDERGRTGIASFCIVALGKLGSYELNYASDIDLLFLYSDDGNTTGVGTRGPLTNREYFIKMAGAVARIVGHESGEGAPYRVDLRLRPHGRDGDLAVSLDEAIRYYRQTAHPWELQTLIRSRSAAGSAQLYAHFAEALRDRVYRQDETVARALSHVRLAKHKIDRQHGSQTKSGAGFNVKLGRGGIREIEFIAQALQLAYGGHDIWLQAPHTLISLGRLADRHMITEGELTQLVEAYVFLRQLEHRLQMEHGLQTHLLPEDKMRRALIARRMHFKGLDALAAFERELAKHLEHVSRAFARVFDGAEEAIVKEHSEKQAAVPAFEKQSGVDVEPATALSEDRVLKNVAAIFAPHLKSSDDQRKTLAARLHQALGESLNPQRALIGLERIAYSLAKLSNSCALEEQKLIELTKLCDTSEYFTEMIAGNPTLIQSLPTPNNQAAITTDYQMAVRLAVEREEGFGAELAALRRVWSKIIIEIGALDAAGKISIRESNARQSALATASVDVSYAIARRELVRRLTASNLEISEQIVPPLAVLGLGRLSGAGLDYGSDLDLILIYEDENLTSGESLRAAELMSRLTELFVTALSSVTREGQLYRIDLRLRPDGKNGPLASPSRAFLDYLQTRAAHWEWLAYVKLRAVGGDQEFGRKIEMTARAVIHRAAANAPAEQLRAETKRVRERLERERQANKRQTIDIKYGAGGMLDVYFATRYLQLKDSVADEGADRSTLHTLDRLRDVGALASTEHQSLSEGYKLLRTVDHYIRLIVGRSTRLQGSDHPALRDIARRSGFDSSAALLARLSEHMNLIRLAYDKVVG